MKPETLPATTTNPSIDPIANRTIENVKIINTAFLMSESEVVLLKHNTIKDAVEELRSRVFYETNIKNSINATTAVVIADMTKQYLIQRNNEENKNVDKVDNEYQSQILHILTNKSVFKLFSNNFIAPDIVMLAYNLIYLTKKTHQPTIDEIDNTEVTASSLRQRKGFALTS